MFDTHAIARRLTDAGIAPDHADAIVDAVRQAGRTRRRRRRREPTSPPSRPACTRFLLVQTAGIVGLTVAIHPAA